MGRRLGPLSFFIRLALLNTFRKQITIHPHSHSSPSVRWSLGRRTRTSVQNSHNRHSSRRAIVQEQLLTMTLFSYWNKKLILTAPPHSLLLLLLLLPWIFTDHWLRKAVVLRGVNSIETHFSPWELPSGSRKEGKEDRLSMEHQVLVAL